MNKIVLDCGKCKEENRVMFRVMRVVSERLSEEIASEVGFEE